MPRLLVVLLLLLSLPSVALGDRGGIYLGGQLGANLIDSVEAVGPNGSFSLIPTAGGMGTLVLGYDFADSHPRLAKGRVEIELGVRQNPLDTVEFSSGEFAAAGDLSALSVLMNFFYEYRGLDPLLVYYGVGGGVARVTMNGVTVDGSPLVDDEDDVLAYQAGLGLGYRLTPALTFDLGYRYFATEDLDLVDVRGRELTTDFQNHSIVLGLRYLFQ